MSDLAMDFDTNDLLIVDGDLSLVDGVDAIQQDLQQSLQLYLGEWFLDTTQGVPYRQLILVKNPNFDVIQSTLLNAILAVDGVVDIVSFNYDYDPEQRELSVMVSVKTTTGDVIKAQASITSTGVQGAAA